MNREEFIKYAHAFLDEDNLSCFADAIAEHNGEVARFGDSGPGVGLGLRADLAKFRKVEAQLARLEGREPRDLRFAPIAYPR